MGSREVSQNKLRDGRGQIKANAGPEKKSSTHRS